MSVDDPGSLAAIMNLCMWLSNSLAFLTETFRYGAISHGFRCIGRNYYESCMVFNHFSLDTFFFIETRFRSNSVFHVFLDVSDICEVDEVVMDMAIADDVFQFLRSAVIATDNFHQEEFYLRRVHTLVTDFLVYMPLKVRTLTSSFTCLSRLEH